MSNVVYVFPYENENFIYRGLTKRELFAAKAMQGLAANPEAWDMTDEKVAEWAYNAADAMLRAREASND